MIVLSQAQLPMRSELRRIDQADRDPGDHALQVGASGRGTVGPRKRAVEYLALSGAVPRPLAEAPNLRSGTGRIARSFRLTFQSNYQACSAPKLYVVAIN